MFMKVLITGGNGNLGRLVAASLESSGTQVISFDLPGTLGAFSKIRHATVLGDIRNHELLKRVLETHKPNAIIHLASMLSGSSEANPSAAWDINASASISLMRLCLEKVDGPFFFASTAATYGPDLTSPVILDTPQWPENVYGATKVAVERMGVYLKICQNLDFRCIRFPMVLSPLAPTGAITAYPSHAIVAATRGEGFDFPVDCMTGMSTIYLNDVTRSIIEICQAKRRDLRHHIYNLHSFYFDTQQLANAIKARYPSFEYTFQPGTSVDNLIRRWPNEFDDQAARQDWGWKPKYDFSATIEALSNATHE
jgi:threonine 3-dehydrogenase|tara:strand:- start:920 stop:1852 length:933 start_codon:yes stop_codon:yes gene_type:complete